MKRVVSTAAVKVPRAPGRPRQFDETTALDGALRAFWTKGFAATSMDDLTTAMDLNRPSVYGAFGNKEALYAASIDRYIATIGRGYLEPLASGGPLAKDLEGFYTAVIDVVTGRHGPLGCIVACTLPAEAGASASARDLLAAVLRQIDGALLVRLTAARRSGELPGTSDVKSLAQVVTSGMFAISIRARAGTSRRELLKLARTFVALVVGS